MLAELQLDLRRMRGAPVENGPVTCGRVLSCDGGLIEVSGLALPIGSLERSKEKTEGVRLPKLSAFVPVIR